jgi:ATP-dependent DNA helicase DinG
MSIDFEAVLGPHLNGYEPRPSQEQMAQAVRDTLETGGRLIVEAGTGTGKSLAYLIPLCEAALSGDIRVAASTFTKALQRQLVEKDLPFIKRFIFPNMTYALCLGSDNYLCLRRLDKAAQYGLFPDEGPELRKLLAWAKTTEHGIREDTPWELWRTVSREADLCHGRD